MRHLLFLLSIFLLQISTSSHAQTFKLGEDSQLIYAKEAVSNTDIIDNKIVVVSATDILNISVPLGFGFSQGSNFVRFDFTNAEFDQAFTTPLEVDADFSSVISQAGGEGDNFIIVELAPNTSLLPSKQITLVLNRLRVLDINTGVTVRYAHYESGVRAVAQNSPLYSITDALLNFQSLSQQDFTEHNDIYADFSKQFFKFETNYRDPQTFSFGDAQDGLASMGRFSFDALLAVEALRPQDSIAISDIVELFPNSDPDEDIISIIGNFSSIKASLNASGSCAGASTVVADYAQEQEYKVSLNDLKAYPYFCVEITNDATTLVRAEYYLDLNDGSDKELLGRIRYNGASVDIPYLTTYEAYRQRIMFTNHTGFDVAYLFHAIYDEDSGLEQLEAASGVIPANSVLKLNTEEVISLTGASSRASARVFFDADQEDISAAVQILAVGSNQPPNTNILPVEQR